jgi:hypothetical protein
MPDALARPLQESVGIGQVDGIRELDIDVFPVRNDPDDEIAHSATRSEGQQMIWQIDRFVGIRERLANDLAQPNGDRANLRGVIRQELVDGRHATKSTDAQMPRRTPMASPPARRYLARLTVTVRRPAYTSVTDVHHARSCNDVD